MYKWCIDIQSKNDEKLTLSGFRTRRRARVIKATLESKFNRMEVRPVYRNPKMKQRKIKPHQMRLELSA